MVESTALPSAAEAPSSFASWASLPDAVVVTDRTGAIRWINDVVEAELGYRLADVVGTSVFDVLHPDELADLLESFATTASRTGVYPPVAARVRSSDGIYHAFEVRARTSTLGEGVDGIVFVARDTTHRDDAQRRLRLVFEHSPAALAMVEPGAIGIEANAPFAALFGYSREALLHTDPALLVHPDDRAEMVHDRELLESGEVTRAEAERRYVRADGSVFHGRSAVTVMHRVDDTIDRFVITVDDITLQQQARELVARSEARFRALVDHSPDIVTIVRADGDWEASEQGTRLLGYRKGFDPPGGVLSLVHPEDVGTAAAALAEVFAGTRAPSEPVEVRLRASDGTYRDFECIGQNLDGDPHVGGVVITARDITRRKHAERALRQAENRFRVAFERAPLVVSIVDLEGRIVEINPAGCELLGRTRDDLVGTFADALVHPADRDRAINGTARQLDGEDARVDFRMLRPDGTTWWALSKAALVDGDDDGGEAYVVTLQADITARKQLEAELARRATRDPLTGLRNRAALAEHLETALQRRNTAAVAVMFVDLDHFKPVNDTYGHSTGDAVLCTVADRLTAAVRSEDVVARVGGDEFVVVCVGSDDDFDVAELGHRLRDAIRRPIAVEEHIIRVGASIGIARATRRDDVATVVMRADAAAYRAKQGGRGRVEHAFE